jgi:hypothetical protein
MWDKELFRDYSIIFAREVIPLILPGKSKNIRQDFKQHREGGLNRCMLKYAEFKN